METKNKNDYFTLSGKKTKDTLTFEEKKELRMKVSDGTITNEERDKLFNDDSHDSSRSTVGSHHVDRIKYNPNVEYFMIDYHLKDRVKWIRMSYMTQFDLLPFIEDFTKNFDDYSGFRIHSERELDVKLEVKCDDGEVRELTQRQILFGNKYEEFSDMVKDKNLPFLEDMKKHRFSDL